jgi:two-component system NtrC family sensor kinase
VNPEKYTILLVDDEPNVIKSLRRLLLETDNKILSADSGPNGLLMFENEPIQLVISDYRMPDMNGVRFLNEVRNRYPDTIRVILSGYADAAAMIEAINDGQVYRFITKPWNDQELLSTVMRALEQYKLQRDYAVLHAELQSRNTELQEFTKTLEDKVRMRTQDLELKNRALIIAQSILGILPVGVLGVDSEQDIVYINDELSKFIDIEKIGLGLSAVGAIDDKIIAVMGKAMTTQQTQSITYNTQKGIGLICTPLSGMIGVIALFIHLDIDNYSHGKSKSLQGAAIG